jgi:hypothetical protein
MLAITARAKKKVKNQDERIIFLLTKADSSVMISV